MYQVAARENNGKDSEHFGGEAKRVVGGGESSYSVHAGGVYYPKEEKF